MKISLPTAQELAKIKKLYRSAFPRRERMPFYAIRHLCRRGKAELLAIRSDSGKFGGFAMTMRDGDIVLLAYFAVHPKLRGKGIGSEALRLLMKRFADSRFILEIEAVDVPCDNLEIRKKRREFYLKNGMIPAGFTANVFFNDFEILTSGRPVTFEEYRRLYGFSRGSRSVGNVTLRQ